MTESRISAHLAPPDPRRPVSTAASIEVGLATPPCVICEAVTDNVPWRSEVADDSHPVDRDGMRVRASERPCLAIEIDLAAAGNHRFERELPQRVFHSGESVGDW